jgi:hypothetical protein
MSTETDYFQRRLIAALRSELFETRQSRFDEWAKDKSISEQIEFLVKDAMKGYREPEGKE